MTGTLRREFLDQLLIVNEHRLRRVLGEYLQHYNAARPHRALGQLTPAQASTRPPELIDLADHRIHRRRRSSTRIVFPSPTGPVRPAL
jgi:hypothetical protein